MQFLPDEGFILSNPFYFLWFPYTRLYGSIMQLSYFRSLLYNVSAKEETETKILFPVVSELKSF